MKNIILIIAGALVGIILFQFLFYKCEGRKKEKELSEIRGQLAECINAPVKLDTLIVRTVLTDTVYLTYKYKVTDTVKVSPAVDWQNQTIEQRFYSGIYEHPQFEVHWSADVTGTLDRLTINPPSLIKSLIITKEKTVDLTKYQECPKIEQSHIYTTLAVITDLKAFKAVDLNLMYIHKKGFGLVTGIQTDFESANLRAGIVLKLK